MTTTPVADELDESGSLHNGGPDRQAPDKPGEQTDRQRGASNRSRFPVAIVLSSLAAVQLVWMTGLGYGLFRLLN
jgi:hypothetical protein